VHGHFTGDVRPERGLPRVIRETSDEVRDDLGQAVGRQLGAPPVAEYRAYSVEALFSELLSLGAR
jgi:hypothetical protein